MKNSLVIETSRDPVILCSFREVDDDKSFLDKFFVSCQLVVNKFSIKRNKFTLPFLLPALNEGRSLSWSDQQDAVTVA